MHLFPGSFVCLCYGVFTTLSMFEFGCFRDPLFSYVLVCSLVFTFGFLSYIVVLSGFFFEFRLLWLQLTELEPNPFILRIYMDIAMPLRSEPIPTSSEPIPYRKIKYTEWCFNPHIRKTDNPFHPTRIRMVHRTPRTSFYYQDSLF